MNQIQMQIAELESALLQAHPSMPVLLQQIHRAIKADPEQVTLLSEQEIGVIVNGLSRQTQTQIATSISTGKKGKAIKSIGLDDL
jgi:hypothetical protein